MTLWSLDSFQGKSQGLSGSGGLVAAKRILGVNSSPFRRFLEDLGVLRIAFLEESLLHGSRIGAAHLGSMHS